MIVIRQEMTAEAKEQEMFNPEDVDHFVSAVFPLAILSSINGYLISLVTESLRAQENSFNPISRNI